MRFIIQLIRKFCATGGITLDFLRQSLTYRENPGQGEACGFS